MRSGRPARSPRSLVRARTDAAVPPKRMNPPTPSASALGNAGGSCAKPPSGFAPERREDEGGREAFTQG